MNSYLSRAEKETFVRLTSLAGLQEQIIAGYAEGKNADKEFLKLLRTSKTWLMKALDYRTSFLDEAAAYDLARQVSKLDLIFVPNDVAKKEYELLKEIKSHIHMPIEDFEDWYCEVIEHTCKTCTREDYQQCGMRRVMAKHGVFPANPEAKNSCQFSYVDADLAELPEPRPPREIVEEQENASIPETVATEEATPELEEGTAVEPTTPEETTPVEIHLASGVQVAFEVSQYMAKQLLQGMRLLPKQNRPICACHIGDDLIAVDTQEVAVFRARGIGECELEQLQKKTWNANALPSRNAPAGNKNAVPSRLETAPYKIECKCGAEYVCYLGADRYKARCRECSASVFKDSAIQEPLENGQEAALMTNRYFVPMDGSSEQNTKREVTPKPKKYESGEYQDPCQIFD